MPRERQRLDVEPLRQRQRREQVTHDLRIRCLPVTERSSLARQAPETKQVSGRSQFGRAPGLLRKALLDPVAIGSRRDVDGERGEVLAEVRLEFDRAWA